MNSTTMAPVTRWAVYTDHSWADANDIGNDTADTNDIMEGGDHGRTVYCKQNSGILRYLKDTTDFKFFEDLLGDSQTMHNYDLRRIARDAMTYGAQRRMAKLPAELRLQIMQAGVLYKYNPPRENIFSVANVEQKAEALFHGEHMRYSDSAVHDVLHGAAEQAYLDKILFSVVLMIDCPNQDLARSIPESLLAQVKHLHVRICVPPSQDDYGPKIEELAKTWDLVKLRMSSLKACVLTLELRTVKKVPNGPEFNDAVHLIGDQDTRVSPELLTTNALEGANVGTILADILDGFVEKYLATRCLARIAHTQLYTGNSVTRSATSYGPLELVRRSEKSGPHDPSEGTRMLAQMYQLARTVKVLEG